MSSDGGARQAGNKNGLGSRCRGSVKFDALAAICDLSHEVAGQKLVTLAFVFAMYAKGILAKFLVDLTIRTIRSI